MTCTFFGHRDSPDIIKGRLRDAIVCLIENKSADHFLVGNEGAFDRMVQSTLAELKRVYPHIDYMFVLSKMPKGGENLENTIYPEEVALCPKKFAIDRRNKWMIKMSDAAIVYVVHITGGAGKCAQAARKHGLDIVEITTR